MSKRPSFLGPTKIATSNPVGDVAIGKPRVARNGGEARDVMTTLLERVRAIVARARSPRSTTH
jgi:hypothetical protein